LRILFFKRGGIFLKKEDVSSTIISTIETIEGLEAVRKLEELVWSKEEAVPVNQTMAAVKNGGFVLGAFFEQQLIGFQYSFPGFDGKNSFLCSHSLGIHPEFRKYGIGEKLKWAQKETAAEKGYNLITWTYDPLETVNGYLNLHKLDAVCSTYLENVYGEMDDKLNAGIPSDRFLVEWVINDKKNSRKYESEKNYPRAISTSTMNGFSIPEKMDLNHKSQTLLVPVPGNFQELKKYSLSLGIAWREYTQAVFKHYFSMGWRAVDLVKDLENPNLYNYLLQKK
jgi:predicted GNAT superfamily acetyltransferase